MNTITALDNLEDIFFFAKGLEKNGLRFDDLEEIEAKAFALVTTTTVSEDDRYTSYMDYLIKMMISCGWDNKLMCRVDRIVRQSSNAQNIKTLKEIARLADDVKSIDFSMNLGACFERVNKNA